MRFPSIPPGLNPDLIERFHGPFDHMKWINTAMRIRTVLLNALINPSGSVSGYKFDRCALLSGQSFKELFKDGFAVPLGDPDNISGVMINDRGDVFVSLFL